MEGRSRCTERRNDVILLTHDAKMLLKRNEEDRSRVQVCPASAREAIFHFTFPVVWWKSCGRSRYRAGSSSIESLLKVLH